MNTKKTVFALLLTLALCLSLCACGGSTTTTLDTSGGAASAPDTAEAALPPAPAGNESEEMVVTAADSGSDIVASAETPSSGSDIQESDYLYITGKGTIVVGVSDFAPMDYQDGNGEWVGFDADMARAFADNLGLEIEFVTVDAADRVSALTSKTVDCIWNGLVLTEELETSLFCSAPYCRGQAEGEVYVVGFRSGSDMASLCNEFLAVSYVGGTMMSIAERYEIQDKLIEQ